MSLTDLYFYASASEEPPVDVTQTLTGSPVYVGVTVPGGSIRLASDPAPAVLSAEVFRHPDYVTPALTLTGLSDYGWQDRVGEAGNGTITIPNLHDDQAAVELEDLVRFKVHGQAAFMAALGTRENRKHPAGDGEAPATTWDGPGHIGLLSEMVVMPGRGPGVKPIEVDRLFSWPSPEFDDSAWPDAVVIARQGEPSIGWGDGSDEDPFLPEGWPPATNSAWIFDATGTQEWAPAGTRYGRSTLTVPSGVNRVMIYFGTDWRGELYVDGQLMITQDIDAGSWVGTTTTLVVDVTPGEHTLAVWCENDVDPEGDMIHNPGGFLVSVYEMDPLGNVIEPPLNMTGADDWYVIFPPSPPGMTPGEVIIIVLNEAQDLGILEGWEVTFTKYVDSKGAPWPVVGDISTKVGTDYLTFILDELAQTYCDVRAQPGGLVLDAYALGTLGSTTGVDLHAATDPNDPSTGNVTELTYGSQSLTASAFLARWLGGWRLVERDLPGRKKMAVLGLGALPSEQEVDRVAGGQLDHHGRQRDAITGGYQPASAAETPYVGFGPGDGVTAPAQADGAPVDSRVMGITVTKNSDNGDPVFALEIDDVLRQVWEKDQTALKKLSDGTLRGDARPAQPVASVGPVGPGPNCCPPQPVKAII